MVVSIDDQDVLPIDTERWGDLVRDVLTAERVTGPCELNLTFIDVDEMTELNIEHMGGTGPTDVLSFPLDDNTDEVFESQPRLLGDIVICPTIVAAQAQGETDDEMALMVVHGVLHILGMDHQETDEAAEMKAAEQRHLASWREQS
jgi:probable rRNA maturation factor